MIEIIKIIKIENYPDENVIINNIKKKNIIIGRNGFGKTTLFKSIRKNIIDRDRNEVQLKFSDEFISNPKHVYFTIPEELDGRAIKDTISPFEADSFVPRTIKTIEMSEMSSGQEQKDILSMFQNNIVYDGCIWFIDEPEKSMDVIELDKFIKYILKLDAQVFINTHSTTLLNDKRFNKIILDEEYNEKMINIFSANEKRK